MWKQQKTSNLIQQLTLMFVISAIFWDTALGLSDKRLCADEECKSIISLGKGLINYHAGQEGMVSFNVNANIRIKSKSAGSDTSLWGIEVNGREGFAPKKLIREVKVIISEKDLKYEVDIVKPGEHIPERSQAPVLNAAKNLVETTTTQPSKIISNGEAILDPLDTVRHEPPQTVTPFQHKNTAVEGNKLPTLDNSFSVSGKVSQQKSSETASLAGNEYEDEDDDGGISDYDDDEEEDDKNQKDSVDSTKEKRERTIATSLASNADSNDRTLTQPLNNKEKTSENAMSSINPNKRSFNENVDATAKSSSTENSQQNTLKLKDIQESVSPLGNDKKLDVQVVSESTEITKSTEEIPTVTNVFSNHTNKTFTESGDILDEQSVEYRKTIAGVMGDSFGTANIAEESDPRVPNKTEEISLNDTNNEELPTATVEQNVVERYVSTQSSLPDTKIDVDLGTEVVPVNGVDIVSHPEQKFSDEAAPNEEVTSKPTEGMLNYLPVQTANQYARDSDNAQANTNQYSSSGTETTKKQINNEFASSQPETDRDSQFNKEEPTNTQTEDLGLNISQNVQSNSEHPTGSQTQSPTTDLPVETTTQFSVEADNVQIITEQDNTQIGTASVPSQSTNDSGSQLNMEIPIKRDTGLLDSQGSKSLQSDDQKPHDTVSVSPQPEHPDENANSEYYTGSQYNPYDYDESSNTPLPPQYNNNNNLNDLPQSTDTPDYHGQHPAVYAPVDLDPEVTTANPVRASTSEDSTGFEPAHPVNSPSKAYKEEEDPKPLPSLTQPVSVVELDRKDNKGLFATIMDTVNNILPNSKNPKHVGYDTEDRHNELDKILFSNMETTQAKSEEQKFCEKLNPNNCPHSSKHNPYRSEEWECSLKTLITTEFTLETFLQVLASKILEISELIAFLAIVAATSLFFIFGYYCFCNSSSEGALLSKLNQLESSLLASHKENAILKHNLMSTRHKLASIEDNSFGSNDMVLSLKKELEEELLEKARLQEQIVTLQKELENAADAGIELNKIVSELLSNQTGDESIISSVEELQKQLNEQQNTILEINASLAEKSRENSELQMMIAEQNARYETQMSDLQQDNDELEAEKGNLQSRLEEIRTDFDRDITAALESKNFEIKRLQNEIVELNDKVEAGHTKWQTSMAKVEALEECLKNVKRDPNVNITQVIDAANIRAELLDAKKKYNGLKERWELEIDARKLAENQFQSATAEVEKIKQDFNQTEKDKLEAQTRLEVLSNYFKEKENQLQKELSLKETMWLKQRGETTTTVDRLTTMQEEIQSLKSQNDALRAEIEAQVAAHKAQTGTLENRAHETWLAARQSDRRYEEARAEATALRRKLTVLAGGSVNEANKPTSGPAGLGDDLVNAPSPIHMESPGSPMLGRMPPPPFLPPPFMGPPPPFMGMPPPPPFVPTGEMRPAPLGRIMSPPPPQRSGHIDYEDYMDYEGNSSWHRHHTYSPPPRTYRSLSPTDSRYNYGTERDLSTYDTETDFSPPPSPRESRRRGGGGGYGGDKEDSNFRPTYINSKNSSSGSKAPISSGSDKSYNSSSKQGTKSKSGGGGGGKFLV